MNDSELEARLRQLSLPERPEEYWDEFPQRLGRKLSQKAAAQPSQKSWMPELAWNMTWKIASLALIMVALSPPLKAASSAIYKNEKTLRREFAQFPGRASVWLTGERGLSELVAEKE